MADILKISTPLVDRLPAQAVRPSAEASVPFDLSNVTRVLQTQELSEILQQNTGFTPGAETPRILADLLGDPAVSASMIRSISMLEEFISLLPGTKDALTREIEQLFSGLLLPPDQIAAELQRQAQTTTLFKGELFNQLRALLSAAGDGAAQPAQDANGAFAAARAAGAQKAELAAGIGILLKGLYASVGRGDVLKSISNNLTFLANSLDASPRLFERLNTLAQAFRLPNAPENFQDLKQQVFAVLKDISQSVLFTPAMEKTLPLVTYNLSRYNDNEDFLPDALRLLLNGVESGEAKNSLVEKLTDYIARYAHSEGAEDARASEEDSRVIDILAKIINKSGKSEAPELVSGERFQKIVHSLLSSPSNFTPLLHFIVPVQHGQLRAFAEFWIDPNAEEKTGRAKGENGQNTHMLMVCDVEDTGRFECEMFVQNRRIALNLLCPPSCVEGFKGIGPAIRGAVGALGYSFESISVEKLERTHSLMEVFTELPHRRAGIDVKI